MAVKFVKNKEGDVVAFDREQIVESIKKAINLFGEENPKILLFLSSNRFENILVKIKEKIDALDINENNFVTFENIYSIVEEVFMEEKEYDLARIYILYRQKQMEKMEKEYEETRERIENNNLMVTKKDGTQEPFSFRKLRNSYNRIANELKEECPFEKLKEGIKKYLKNGMKTDDLQTMIIKSAIDLIQITDPEWQFIAGRFLTLKLYKEASRNRLTSIDNLYSGRSFRLLVKKYVKEGLYSKSLIEEYTKEELEEAGKSIVKNRDMEYNYTTVNMLYKRYLLNPNKIVRELPQEMYMAVALFLAIPEKKEERLKIALEIYDATSSQKISLPTPTLMNARTPFHQLSSCFKLNVDDDLRSIYSNIENMAQISKYGGGIGTYLGHIRSKGAYIRGRKGASGGVLPWIKVINDTAVAVNQLGSRSGAISTTLDIWHKDIYDFLAMQTETGDIRRKSFDVFPAITIPDLFMKRLQENGKWTLFDPKEVNDKAGKRLENLWGKEFEDFYIELENRSDLELREQTDAKELFKTFLKSVVETGMPYVFFRDTGNKMNPNKHSGMVYSSQLCQEIIQNTSPAKFIEEVSNDGVITTKYQSGDAVVCNLASINVAKVNKEKDIRKIIPIAMRILDNVITLNFYPTKEAEITAMKYRSVGLGFLGLAEYLATNKLSYDKADARENVDKLFELYAYYTLKASNEIAIERGKYQLFDGSDWSKGILFGKTEEQFNNNLVNWKELIENIKEKGLRFSYHLSPAPNTSCQSGNNKVITKNGITTIYQILKEQGFNIKEIENKEAHWIKLKNKVEIPTYQRDDIVEKIWYNGYQNVKEIEFEDGKKYKFTNNHKLLVLREGKQEWIRVDELKEGDDILNIFTNKK